MTRPMYDPTASLRSEGMRHLRMARRAESAGLHPDRVARHLRLARFHFTGAARATLVLRDRTVAALGSSG